MSKQFFAFFAGAIAIAAIYFDVLDKNFFTASLPAAFEETAPTDSSIIARSPPKADEEAISNPDDNSAGEIASSAASLIPRNDEERQEILDDIAEKLDVIRKQVAELEAKIHPVARQDALSNDRTDPETQNSEPVKWEAKPPAQELVENLPQANIAVASGGGGGGAASVFYPIIIISEIQLKPIEQRFIELYNPNSQDISLTDWYLQRKTETGSSWNSLVSSTKFEGKKILAGGYFLISRSDASANIFIDNLTLTENNYFALKNPNRDTDDELIMNGVQNPAEGQSFCREFNICSPTPKAKNQKWTEPEVAVLGELPAEGGIVASGDILSVSGDIAASGDVSAASGDVAASGDIPASGDITQPVLPSITVFEITIAANSVSIDTEFSEKTDYKILILSGSETIKKWEGEAKNPRPKTAELAAGGYAIKVYIKNGQGYSAEEEKTINIQ